MSLFVLLCTVAYASSLDNLEVGGAWGTPTATNPTAAWWNPGGLAIRDGFQLYVEGAPTVAGVKVVRDNPDYGTIDPANALDLDGDGDDELTYDYGGEERFTYSGVAPFVGASFSTHGFGIGAALAVPTARGGSSDQEMGPSRYALRDGDITAIHAILGVAYDIADKVAIGATGSFVSSRWDANIDTEVFSSYGPAFRDQLSNETINATYQSGYIEDPSYTTTLDFDVLTDTTWTFGTGVLIHPIDKLDIGIAYNHGISVVNEGDVALHFSCPPLNDGASTLAAGLTGTCITDPDSGERVPATLNGTSSVGYSLPGRLHLGVALRPSDPLRLELFGAWVRWSAFTEYDIYTNIPSSAVPVEDPVLAQFTSDLVSQHRAWARDNVDTFFVAFDTKVEPTEKLTLGGRVMYDHGAVPSAAMSANNFDMPSIIPSIMGQFRPSKAVGIGASWGHTFMTKRVITDSAFAIFTSENYPPEPGRYFWPESNGTYTGHIDRFGVSLMVGLGGEKDPVKRADPKKKPDPGPR